MSALNEMIDMLSPLGIYSLSRTSLVYKELKVYAYAFLSITQYINSILREAFVSSAENDGLALKEQLFGSERPDLTVSERRERLITLLSLCSDDFTEDDIRNQLLLSGISNGFTADAQNETFALLSLPQTNDPVELSVYSKAVDKIAPAHLFPLINIGEMTWDSIDGYNHTFWEWDNAAVRFDMIE